MAKGGGRERERTGAPLKEQTPLKKTLGKATCKSSLRGN